MRLIDQQACEQALEDEAYRDQIKRELAAMARESLVEWARGVGPNVLIATYSAVNGAWDDVYRDLQRNRITPAQAFEIVNQFKARGLVTDRQAQWYRQKFQAVQEHGL